MYVIFDCEQPYYLPQYTPVIDRLISLGHRVGLAWHQEEPPKFANKAVEILLVKANAVVNRYAQEEPDWLVFGNQCQYLNGLNKNIKTALLFHGIGLKACYHKPELLGFDVRFVEGDQRLTKLASRYPNEVYHSVGFAKLDPLFSNEKQFDTSLQSLNLDNNKKTVLYAPTFFPSSIECLADDWPEQLKDLNIIIKPHYFSLTRPKYQAHRTKFEFWKRYKNVHFVPVECQSILPYMAISDVIVSGASSVLFEFAALDKAVIWSDFSKLRWSYRGPLAFRLKMRVGHSTPNYANVATRVTSVAALSDEIRTALSEPAGDRKARLSYVQDLIGVTDGCASQRIVDYLESNLK